MVEINQGTGLKEKWVTIDAEGRDQGKLFKLTEMSALRAERWATRAFLGLVRGGIEIPDYVRGAGMAGLAMLGFRALGNLPYEEAITLMDELMTCVSMPVDKDHIETVRPLRESDIMEVWTRMWLKDQVFELHTGFSLAGLKSTLTSAPAEKAKVETTSDTPTSPAQ